MNNQDMEDVYEKRRLVLKAKVDSLGKGAISSIAKALDKDPSYISRCLYPQGKSGKKNIGDEFVIHAIEKMSDLGSELLKCSETQAAGNEKVSYPQEASRLIASLQESDQAEILHWLRMETIRRRHASEK